MNRFAALNLSSDEELSDDQDSQETKTNEAPVTYSIKIDWKIGEAIYNLRAFKIQSVRKLRNGTLLLRFTNEIEAEKAFRHIRQQFKLKISPLKVPPLEERICFHCRREDHWGDQCTEGSFLTLPADLYGRIAADLTWPDTFAFLYTSKKLFQMLAQRVTEVVLARPQWLKQKKITLKLGVLRLLKNLNKLVLKALKSSTYPSPQVIASLSRLTSLSIVSCLRPNNQVLDEALLRAIGRLTRLSKLDLDQPYIQGSNLGFLTNLSNLTQLRLAFDCTKLTADQFDMLKKFEKLKKLGLHFQYGTTSHVLSEDLLGKLTSLSITKQLPVILPAKLLGLKKLYFAGHSSADVGLKSAPNLTKLKWYTSDKISFEDCFDNLVSLTITIDNLDNWKVDMPQLKKLVINCRKPLVVDLQGAISLEKLVYNWITQAQLKHVPHSLQEIIVIPTYYLDFFSSQDEWTKLNIRSFQLIAEKEFYTGRPEETAQFFSNMQHCSTLRYLKLDSLPEECLSHLNGFTQLRVLDLVNNPVVLADKQRVSQSKMLELSEALPDTRIKYGFDPPTSTKRDTNHWYIETMNNRDYDPFWRCKCRYCREWEENNE